MLAVVAVAREADAIEVGVRQLEAAWAGAGGDQHLGEGKLGAAGEGAPMMTMPGSALIGGTPR
jgi:hypothetical protein